MSHYREFTRDFPARCRDVLKMFRNQAQRSDREVTLLLMATSAGFVMPYERLSISKSNPQPLLDRGDLSAEIERLSNLLKETVKESDLLPDFKEWSLGGLNSAEGMPDTWPELSDPLSVRPLTPVKDIIRPLRHSLAHGNVYTRPDARGQIQDLVFISGGVSKNPLRYLLVSPDRLAAFMDRWFALVSSLPLTLTQVLEVVSEAA